MIYMKNMSEINIPIIQQNTQQTVLSQPKLSGPSSQPASISWTQVRTGTTRTGQCPQYGFLEYKAPEAAALDICQKQTWPVWKLEWQIFRNLQISTS